MKDGSVKFAVIGDSGTGDQPQYQTARVLDDWRADFPFDLVLMLGDNIYGRSSPADYRRKFEEPYRALLDAGVKFYAALGNHDVKGCRAVEESKSWQSCLRDLRASVEADRKAAGRG